MTEVIRHQQSHANSQTEKKTPRRKPKKNAQEVWSSLSNDDGFLESVAGSTCSSHISLVRIELAKETPLEAGAVGAGGVENEGSEMPDHLSDLLAHLADVERRGIDILNSREDLMDLAAFSNPSSPPPERARITQESDSMDFIPPTSEQDTKSLMQSVSEYKSKKGASVGSPPPVASPPQILSPKSTRLTKIKPIINEATATDMNHLMEALAELNAAENKDS